MFPPRKRIVLLLPLLCLAAITAPAGAENPRLITVTGDAEVRVAPDEVVLILGAETRDPNLIAAKTGNDERVGRALAAARSAGIAPRHIQTSEISIQPEYDNRVLIGYVVRKTIVLTLREIARFEELLTNLLQAGANYVHGIDFRTTELRKYRDQARALAIRAAREKAVALAGELGQKVGRPQTISEQQSGWRSGYYGGWGGGYGASQNVAVSMGGGSEIASGMAPGQITVSATVSVSFALEPGR